MLWVWLTIVGSLALAAYLWMRIDEAHRPAGERGGGARPAQAVSANAKPSP